MSNDKPILLALYGSPVASGVPGAYVGSLAATVPNVADVVTYSVIDPRFQIVGDVLDLAPGVALDYDTAHVVKLKVTATVVGGKSLAMMFDIPVAGISLGTSNLVQGSWGASGAEGMAGSVGQLAQAVWNQAQVKGTHTNDSVYIDLEAHAGAGGGGGGGHNYGWNGPGDTSVTAGGVGGDGGRSLAEVTGTDFALNAGHDNVVLVAQAYGGAGGEGGLGGSATWADSAIGGQDAGAGGNGGDAAAIFQNLTFTATGSLSLYLDGYALGGAGGSGAYGGAGGNPVNHPYDIIGGTGGHGSNEGASGIGVAEATGIAVKATGTSGADNIDIHLEAIGGGSQDNTGGQGGNAGLGLLPNGLSFQGGQPGNGGNGGLGGDATAELTNDQILTGSGNDLVTLDLSAQEGRGGVAGAAGNPAYSYLGVATPPSPGNAGVDGMHGNASLTVTGNVVKLGAGDDKLVLDLAVTDPDGDALGLSTAFGNFTFSGNNFQGGTGNNTLDLSGVRGAAATVDVAHDKLFLADSAANVMVGFNIFVGTHSGDTFFDGAGSQTYTGGGGLDRFVFKPGHGTDTIDQWSGLDVMTLKGFGAGLQSFADVMANSADGALGVTISTPDGGSVLLPFIAKADLVASEFLFA